jgi:2-amino-4-hydroxy-6-hydroxymethyldihydropteridine diphosphokinase
VDRVTAAIGIGSNLGPRETHLEFARHRLAGILSGLRMSSPRETIPVEVPPQPLFLNAAAVGETILSAHDLLSALLTIERDCGRTRPFPGAARTLDLDLLLYGDAVINAPELTVPHPRLRQRAFVLEPLAEIAPDLRDPVTGQSIAALLGELRSGR